MGGLLLAHVWKAGEYSTTLNSTKSNQHEDNEETNCPWKVFHGNVALVHSVLDEAGPELERVGLADGKALFLLLAAESDPYPAEIARRLLLPKPTVTFLIKRAEAAGHLTRSPDPDDLRRVRLKLTRRGRSAAREGQSALEGIFEKRLTCLTAKEQQVFRSCLFKLAGGR